MPLMIRNAAWNGCENSESGALRKRPQNALKHTALEASSGQMESPQKTKLRELIHDVY